VALADPGAVRMKFAFATFMAHVCAIVISSGVGMKIIPSMFMNYAGDHKVTRMFFTSGNLENVRRCNY